MKNLWTNLKGEWKQFRLVESWDVTDAFLVGWFLSSTQKSDNSKLQGYRNMISCVTSLCGKITLFMMSAAER